MSFTSVVFLFIFFPMCFCLYYISLKFHSRLSNILLLIFDVVFYAWAGVLEIQFLVLYIILVFLLGRIAFLCGKCEESNNDIKKYKKQVMGVIITILLLILFFYKYYEFFEGIFSPLVQIKLLEFNLIAPLGLSYLTFSGISYVVDIYRGDSMPGSLIETGNYIAFFPKIACGPIALHKDFYKKKRNQIDINQIIVGINRIIIGMIKKIIFADYFGSVLASIPSNGIDQLTALFTIIIYSLQLVFDFSGYSDMAIGLGVLFGYSLPENFKYPYFSFSITEFWRRWHISLGSFFREYLYIPLGGNRKGRIRTLLNLFLVFLATGIWHGAGWNYLIWGSLHGICVVSERLGQKNKVIQRIPAILKWVYTIVIVFIGWQFFRYSDINGIHELFYSIYHKPEGVVLFTWEYYLTIKLAVMTLIGFVMVSFMGAEVIQKFIGKIQSNQKLLIIKQILLLILFIVAICSMVSSTYSPFLYFRY